MCYGGNTTHPDRCYEICGDGRKFNNDRGYCDDGNNQDGDGCSSECRVEPGMKCEGGTTSNVDKCFEPCGDGRNAGFYKCDDGNMFDGDGCSSLCDVEPGF